MDFSLPADLEALGEKVLAFVKNEIIPYETDPRWTAHGPTEELRRELTERARKAGLLAVHVPKEYGGLGLNHVGKAVVFEAAGYSMLGPVALHCQAPDEGNIHLLEKVANPEQKERYLRPLASGEVRSCFAMTEPHPGAGSDPSMLSTRAEKDGNGFVLRGRKWLITGADGAAFAIIMARTGDDPNDATMFLADLPNPAFRISRVLDTMDSSFMGGHAVVEIEDLRLPGDAVLGEIGQGFRYAQVRLAPARLTHCMRWLGAAQRAHTTSPPVCPDQRIRPKTRQPRRRQLHARRQRDGYDVSRLRSATARGYWIRGTCPSESSMAKVIARGHYAGGGSLDASSAAGADARYRRRADLPRCTGFRIYDGPSEVHRWAGRVVERKWSNKSD